MPSTRMPSSPLEIQQSLKRTRLESASADGIMLSGMEPDGVDRQAREVFKYQEWWLRYPRVSSA